MEMEKQKNMAQLILVPTPLDEEAFFSHETIQHFLSLEAQLEEKEESLIVVEEIKIGRRRWLNSGLPRGNVDKMLELNEHNVKEQTQNLLRRMKNEGKRVYLMSDGGLPAFCDPGRELVEACHKNGIKVTSLPFPNSVALSIALSGLPHDKWMFEGFLPKEKKERELLLKSIIHQNPWCSVLMDTPYRLYSLLEEIAGIDKDKTGEYCLVMDLSLESEEIIRGNIGKLLGHIKPKMKREFVLVVGKGHGTAKKRPFTPGRNGPNA